MSDPATRAEEARRKILASGNPDLIDRLHLLEATAARGGATPTQTQPQAPQQTPAAGPGLLGLGLAVAGGAWLGTVLGGLTLSAEMQDAFGAVAEDLGLDPGDPALADGAAMEATDTAGAAEAGDGGLFDDFGGFFDI